MDHGVAALHGALDGAQVEQIGTHVLDVARAVVRRLAQVEDANGDPVGAQAVDDMRADEAGAAGDQDSHAPASER